MISQADGRTLFPMSQDVRERLSEKVIPAVCQGPKPGDVRIKLRRRTRGKIAAATSRVRTIVSRVVPR